MDLQSTRNPFVGIASDKNDERKVLRFVNPSLNPEQECMYDEKRLLITLSKIPGVTCIPFAPSVLDFYDCNLGKISERPLIFYFMTNQIVSTF